MATATPPVTRSPLLSREQAAEYLGIKSQTLAAWAAKGNFDLPLVKIGRLAKYRLVDLDAYLSRHTLTAANS